MQVVAANGASIPAIGLGTWDLRGRTCVRRPMKSAIGAPRWCLRGFSAELDDVRSSRGLAACGTSPCGSGPSSFLNKF